MNENHWLNEIFPDAEKGENNKKKLEIPSKAKEDCSAILPDKDTSFQDTEDEKSENISLEEAPADPMEETKVFDTEEPQKEITKYEETAKEDEKIAKEGKKTKAKEVSLSFAGSFFDWVKTFLFSLIAVIFIFTLLFRGVTVRGDSMLPTLKNNQYLIISDLFYTPKCGDIIVARSMNYREGKEPVIKRVIATEGQTVKLNFKTWQVWVDDVLLEEDYVYFEPGFMMASEDLIPDVNYEAEITVNDNCVFVMGDHRNDSLDSRSESVGQIDTRYIMGRVILRVTPLNEFGTVN